MILWLDEVMPSLGSPELTDGVHSVGDGSQPGSSVYTTSCSLVVSRQHPEAMKAEAARPLKAEARGHHTMPATFYWPEQVRGQPSPKEGGNRLHLLLR